MQALHDVVCAGWVRYIGMSSCWAWQCAYQYARGSRLSLTETSLRSLVHAMQSMSLSHCSINLVDLYTRQTTQSRTVWLHSYRCRITTTWSTEKKSKRWCLSWRYFFLCNLPSAFFVSLCQHFGVASTPWSPLARGLLARPARAERTTRGSFDQYV